MLATKKERKISTCSLCKKTFTSPPQLKVRPVETALAHFAAFCFELPAVIPPLKRCALSTGVAWSGLRWYSEVLESDYLGLLELEER